MNNETFGTQIQAVQYIPVYVDEPYAAYPTVTEKTIVTLENVHTDGLDSPDDHNILRFQFQAVLVDPKIPTNWLKNGKDYYITAGVEYSDGAYIWVGQGKVTTVLLTTV